jgi:hypothetical protein
VVDDGADSDGAADRSDMAVQPFVLGLDQIMPQQQNPVGAGLFRPLCKFDRQRRALADARDDRQPAPGGLNRSRDDVLVLGELQRKELSGSPRREQRCGTVTDEIVDVLLVRTWRKRALVSEMRHRKGQQSRPDG